MIDNFCLRYFSDNDFGTSRTGRLIAGDHLIEVKFDCKRFVVLFKYRTMELWLLDLFWVQDVQNFVGRNEKEKNVPSFESQRIFINLLC